MVPGRVIVFTEEGENIYVKGIQPDLMAVAYKNWPIGN
jgi:hypothetical protein